MGLPWLPVKSNGLEELEILDLKEALEGRSDNIKAFNEIWPNKIPKPQNLQIINRKIEIDALVTGALRSDYQKTRIDRMCDKIGIKSFSPLWHKDPEGHMRSLLSHGFEIKFVSVSCEGLDSSWLGETLNESKLERLISLSKEYRFNIDGEGGEFETITTNGPHMSKRICCHGTPIFSSGRGEWEIEYMDIE
jgi:uncharacterized protein (TIGR00290 family)